MLKCRLRILLVLLIVAGTDVETSRIVPDWCESSYMALHGIQCFFGPQVLDISDDAEFLTQGVSEERAPNCQTALELTYPSISMQLKLLVHFLHILNVTLRQNFSKTAATDPEKHHEASYKLGHLERGSHGRLHRNLEAKETDHEFPYNPCTTSSRFPLTLP